ncbi:MAG TPA: DUF1553 domain-containing protein, partial [Verrucomicrobiae bacterium]
HKYDPFTTVEYYRAMAFLNSTEDADYDDEKPTMKVFKPGQKEQLDKLRDTVKAAEKKLSDTMTRPEFARGLEAWEMKIAAASSAWQTLDPTNFTSSGGASLTKNQTKSIIASGENPKNDTYVVTASVGQGRITGVRLEVLEMGVAKALGRDENGGFVLSKFELEANGRPVKFKSASADFSEKNFDVTNILTGKGDGWAVATSEPKNKVRRSAYFTLAEPLDQKEDGALTFTLRHSDKHPGANILRFRLYTTSSEDIGPPSAVPDDVKAILAVASGKRDDKQRARLNEYFASIAPELKPLNESVAAAKKAEKEFYDKIPISSVMAELAKPRETRRHVRGGYLSVAEVVQPGTPASLHPFLEGQPANRLGFARWLVDTNNPLTARVIINRFWEQYFGKGIVETVEEFGKQGEPPSHPELLDWLASEFMAPVAPVESLNRLTVESAREGRATHPPNASTLQPFNPSTPLPWNMKAMHKLIVTSATYRQSSKVGPRLVERDPYNRLLARGPRVRLEAEMIRDQALAISGLLSRKMGGPSVMPPQPDGLWQVVYSGDKWETSKGEDKYRRGLYTFWRRTTPYPSMVTFDAPSREFCVVRRSRSNTPLQALTLLNDPAYVEAAQALARRMMTEGGATVEARATHGFRLCLARAPRPEEIKRLVSLYQTELAQYRQDAKAAEKMANSELGKAPSDLSAEELAAWTVLANVLLNLDETITKG